MKRIATACLLVGCLLLTGCGLLSPPKAEPARALLAKEPDNLPRERERGAALLVLPTETSPVYDTTRMAYTLRPYEIGYFRDHEWAETPAQMLNDLLVHTMREIGYFKAVSTSPAAQGAMFRLQASILELLEDHTVNPPVLRFALRVRLFDTTGQPIADRDIRRDQALKEPNPYAGVVAANEATSSALREAAQFVLEAVRTTGVRSAASSEASHPGRKSGAGVRLRHAGK